MCTYPFAKKALTLHLARGEGRERYFSCNLMQRKVLASSHQHLMAEAPLTGGYAILISTGSGRDPTPLALSRAVAGPQNVLHEDDQSILVADSSPISRKLEFMEGTGRQHRDLFISYVAALERHEIKVPRLEPFYRGTLHSLDTLDQMAAISQGMVGKRLCHTDLTKTAARGVETNRPEA